MLEDERLGRYKIISKIGSGGMGDVYLAEDVKLERKVALKTLPTDVASDSERMSRFIHEAKTASALNHPNIITIYEINDEVETPFIAMEYVPGNTITKLLKGSRALDIDIALDISIQVAGALSAAHDANVVHRDIKPDNIIVRPDGVVKVLDFGLAKLTENDGLSDPEAETIAHRTNPGMILGTASFMSPEQARGKEIDGRSDIFSFGTVLFQMFAGRLPFSGENYIDVIASILHKEPPPLFDFSPEIPQSIDSLVRKCLRKNRDERFQTAKELQADLRDIRQDLNLEMRSGIRRSFVSTQVASLPTQDDLEKPFATTSLAPQNTSSIREAVVNEVKLHPIRVMAGVMLTLAVLTGLGVGINRISKSEITTAAFQSMRFNKVTSTGDVSTEQVAISAEGKLLVYVTKNNDKESIWVKQAEAPSGFEIVPPSNVRYRGLAVSPDSNHVFYVAIDEHNNSTLFQTPVLGGSTRKLITAIKGPISFSPDMTKISFIRDANSLMVANIDGTDIRQLAVGKNGNQYNASTWTPDNRSIIASTFSPSDSLNRLVEISLLDGSQREFTEPWIRISGVAWLPGANGVVISGRDVETQLSQIWFVSYPEGVATRITNDPGNYLGVSVSADGQSIASVQMNRQTNIWFGKPEKTDSGIRITSSGSRDEGMSGIVWTPDGRAVHTVRITGTEDLWITDKNTSKQLTFNSRANMMPAVSADGQHIVFISTRNGSDDLWRMDINGENQILLSGKEGMETEPKFTPDGRSVIYGILSSDKNASVWKISIDGGNPTILVNDNCYKPEISTDGKFIACFYGEKGTTVRNRVAVYPINGGEALRIIDLPNVVRSRTFKWSEDGRAFLYIDNRSGFDNIWRQPLDGGEPTQVTGFTSENIYRFDVSTKNLGFVFSRGSESSDVISITNIKH